MGEKDFMFRFDVAGLFKNVQLNEAPKVAKNLLTGKQISTGRTPLLINDIMKVSGTRLKGDWELPTSSNQQYMCKTLRKLTFNTTEWNPTR
jgi:hypothetical protein